MLERRRCCGSNACMSDAHSRIIATAARAELASLGFQRKGRSRLWLADRGYWLNVVEFTPSRWSKSVSLMNAAHWLWVGAGFMSFNETISSNCYAEFETEDQFRGAASEIAKVARANALALEGRFRPSIGSRISSSNAPKVALRGWVPVGGVTKQASPRGWSAGSKKPAVSCTGSLMTGLFGVPRLCCRSSLIRRLLKAR